MRTIPEGIAIEELTLRWNNSRMQLKELLESLPESLLDKYIFKHPVAGKMNIYGGLDFLKEHVRRHEFQIKKLLAHGNEKL